MQTAEYQPYRSNYCRRSVTPATDRQLDVLKFIKAHIEEHSFPPSQRDIQCGMGFKSCASPTVHLRELEVKGYIAMKRGVARSIRILSEDERRERVVASRTKARSDWRPYYAY